MQKTSVKFFLLLSFIEGSAVMATELLGAKMLAPFFGSSLYVWSSVMAITLGGLAAGYFAGGIFSTRNHPEKTLYKIMIGAAVFTVLLPFTSSISLQLFGYFSLLPAVTINAILILFPPVFLMGMVSPLIIRNIASDAADAGKSAGTVYAISTLGGILATFAFGFSIIPHYGLIYPSVLTGMALGILPLIQMVKKKEYSGLVLIVLAFWSWTASHKAFSSQVKIVYQSEGLLGQILVVDFPNDIYYNDSTRRGEYSRWMFVNRVSQTMNDLHADIGKGEERFFTYVYRMGGILDTMKLKGKDVLLLGLGGGSVATHLHEKGFHVEACELDQRIVHVAKTYFELSDEVNVHVDDARHFVKTAKKKYDVLIFDTFKGEETPSHILTTQSLAEVKKILQPDGVVLINSFGFFNGERGRGMRSIYKTLQHSGFHVRILPTEKNEDLRNLVFIASLHPLSNHPDFLHVEEKDLSDALVLTDDYPVFELINAPAGLSWRKASIRTFRMDPNQKAIPVFE